jgi:hypothetical protein
MKMALVLCQWQITMIPNVIFVGKLSEIMIVLRNTNPHMLERNVPDTIVCVLQTVILVLEESNLTVIFVVKDIVIEVIC